MEDNIGESDDLDELLYSEGDEWTECFDSETDSPSNAVSSMSCI